MWESSITRPPEDDLWEEKQEEQDAIKVWPDLPGEEPHSSVCGHDCSLHRLGCGLRHRGQQLDWWKWRR